METKKTKLIRVEGHIINAPEYEFNDEFLEWLDSKGWLFMGIIEEEDSE